MERRLARIAALPLSLCLAIPALAHGTPGPASGEAREVTTSAWADAHEAATEARLLDVATSGPPLQAYVAARFLHLKLRTAQDPGDTRAASGLVRRALEAGRDDWVLVHAEAECSMEVSLSRPADEVCDRSGAAERLAVLGEGNAYVHLSLSSIAARAGDQAASDAQFAAAASATHYDEPVNRMGAAIVAVIRGIDVPPMPEDERIRLERDLRLVDPITPEVVNDIHAMAMIAGLALPAYADLQRRCFPGGEVVADQDLHAQCLAIYGHMARHGRHLLALLLANTSLARLAPDAPAGIAARERLRVLLWLQASHVDLESGMSAADFRRFVDDFVERSEVVAIRNVLARAGRASTPPADWLPDNARQADLISHGIHHAN